MKKLIAVILAASFMLVAGVVHAAQVPRLINFQSVLYDDAGEAIPDGAADVTFSITDIDGNVLYREMQTLDVVRGMVSAMVGNGLTSSGAPTGGVPLDIFEADEGRYLDITVDGYQPQATMEIVAVPYALVAMKALSAAKHSIDGDAIMPGAITAEHFSRDTLKELGGALVSSASLSVSTAAESIGVRPGFSYSGSSNIQGVLTDLDRVVAQRSVQVDTNVDALQTAIADETSARTNSDTGLQSQIDGKVSKAGDTMSGNLVVKGMDVNTHTHGGGATGAYLYPSALWYDAGIVPENTVVSLGVGFVDGECSVTTAMGQFPSNVEGVDQACSRFEWISSTAFKVRCRYSGGHEADNCQDYWKNPPDGMPCNASFAVLCVKGM